MSVQPGPTFKRYAANGAATVYAIPFLLLDAADLQITLNGVLVITGFTLSGIGSPTSSCTFTAAPSGDLLFQQMVPFQRLADYQINGDFLAQTVNRDFDRLWLAIKQLSRDSNRAFTVSLLEPEGIPPLPAKAVRALKMLAFDANGDPIPSNLTMAQIEQQPALALESAAQAAASASASLASSLNSYNSATESSNAAIRSMAWAENPEDTPVQPGLFSAHHWANKAAALVASISALYTRMTAVELRATNLEFGYVSPQQTYANGGTITLNHGLGVKPNRVSVEMLITTTIHGYPTGASIPMGEFTTALDSTNNMFGFSNSVTTTQIVCKIANNGLIVISQATGATAVMVPANCRLIFKASKS